MFALMMRTDSVMAGPVNLGSELHRIERFHLTHFWISLINMATTTIRIPFVMNKNLLFQTTGMRIHSRTMPAWWSHVPMSGQTHHLHPDISFILILFHIVKKVAGLVKLLATSIKCSIGVTLLLSHGKKLGALE